MRAHMVSALRLLCCTNAQMWHISDYEIQVFDFGKHATLAFFYTLAPAQSGARDVI